MVQVFSMKLVALLAAGERTIDPESWQSFL